jgi:hypothetical protein
LTNGREDARNRSVLSDIGGKEYEDDKTRQYTVEGRADGRTSDHHEDGGDVRKVANAKSKDIQGITAEIMTHWKRLEQQSTSTTFLALVLR